MKNCSAINLFNSQSLKINILVFNSIFVLEKKNISGTQFSFTKIGHNISLQTPSNQYH